LQISVRFESKNNNKSHRSSEFTRGVRDHVRVGPLMDLANTAASLLDAEEDIVGPLEAFPGVFDLWRGYQLLPYMDSIPKIEHEVFPGVFDLLLIKLLLQVIIPLLQRDFAGLAGVNLVV